VRVVSLPRLLVVVSEDDRIGYIECYIALGLGLVFVGLGGGIVVIVVVVFGIWRGGGGWSAGVGGGSRGLWECCAVLVRYVLGNCRYVR